MRSANFCVGSRLNCEIKRLMREKDRIKRVAISTKDQTKWIECKKNQEPSPLLYHGSHGSVMALSRLAIRTTITPTMLKYLLLTLKFWP